MSRLQRAKEEKVGGEGAIQPCAGPHACVPVDRKPKGHQRFSESKALHGDPLLHFSKKKVAEHPSRPMQTPAEPPYSRQCLRNETMTPKIESPHSSASCVVCWTQWLPQLRIISWAWPKTHPIQKSRIPCQIVPCLLASLGVDSPARSPGWA